MADPVLVVGGSVAALVAADALAREGRPVRLLLPGRVGSGFLPVPAGARLLELGPRLIELAYDDAPGDPPPLRDYEPGPHGHRPYLALIDALVHDLAGDDLRAVRRPELTRGGRRVVDFLLGGDLSMLPELLPADRDAIGAEAAAAAAREGPAGLLDAAREPELWARSFADASVANHGTRFHDLVIEAIAAKILPGGSASVIAALRRRIWLPLFFPRTLAEACNGALTYRPDRPMHTVEGGGMGAIVQRLLERIRTSDQVAVTDASELSTIAGARDGVTLTFASGPAETARRAIVGLPPEELFRAAGIAYEPSRVRLSIAWVDVDEAAVVDAPSVLFVADSDVPLFRVSESGADAIPGRRTFSCELHHSLDETALGAAAVEGLRRLGVITGDADASVVRAGVVPAFATPSSVEHIRFDEARRAFDALELPVEVVGGAAGFLADSFNEQVVQGLRAAALSG